MFDLRLATESDRTYLARLNLLTELFDDELAPLPEHYAAYRHAYVDSWVPTHDGGIIATDYAGVPAGGCWMRRWTGEETYLGAGFIDAETPELCLAVEARFRRQGLSGRLIDAACSLAASQGAEQVSLAVDDANPNARAAYDKLGFKPVGRSHDVYTVMVRPTV